MNEKKARLCCRECGSSHIEIRRGGLAELAGKIVNGEPNVEIYCYSCTASYCIAEKEARQPLADKPKQ